MSSVPFPAAVPVRAERLRPAPAPRSLGGKLFLALLSVLLLAFGALGLMASRRERRLLEEGRLAAADRISEVLLRSTAYDMLRNDRDALREIVATVGHGAGVVAVRISGPDGRIALSSLPNEVGLPSARPAHGTGRWIRNGPEGRILGTRTAIDNTAGCSEAACHAHPASQRVLGVLDVDVSLAETDLAIRRGTVRFAAVALVGMLLVLGTIALVVYRLVHLPVRALRIGTERLRSGELGVQIPVRSGDELGLLALSFNGTSAELREARRELDLFTERLEARVREKTAELSAAHERMLRAEKLTSLGKLAAVVAHEINNPLFGILTYAKLMRKWIERGDPLEAHRSEMKESLTLVESESRRCGDIVRDLLTFARVQPMNVTDVDLHAVLRQILRLVAHRLSLSGVEARLLLDEKLPTVRGDAGQIEQLLLALVMNAIDAMPHGGVLTLTTVADPRGGQVVLGVEDDGVGIPAALLPRLFDPFVTTKEEGKGVGLGLAISRSIVERHAGTIDVDSKEGKGTRFTITLPTGAPPETEGTR